MVMNKSPDNVRAAREAQLDDLHEQLTNAVEKLITGEDWARALTFAARFRSRSFNNVLLIEVQHQAAFDAGRVPEPFPTFVAGYRQWEALGRHVDKGQHGYAILAPVTSRFASFAPNDRDSWRRLGQREQPKPGEVVRTQLVGVRPAHVFDVSQTSGIDLPTSPEPKLLEGAAPEGLAEGLARQVEDAGYTVLMVPHEGMISGANGLTNFETRQVAVRQNMDAAAQVKTLAHELAHVLMHDPNSVEVRQHRGVAEVEAESVALMIGAAHGMDTTAYTIPYVATWASRIDGDDPVHSIQATGARVQKAAVKILDKLPTAQVGDRTVRDAVFAAQRASEVSSPAHPQLTPAPSTRSHDAAPTRSL